MTRTVEFEIDLSFAGYDGGYGNQVANLSRDSGVKVFYDIFEEDNLWGKNLYDHLSDAYQNKVLYTILFISEHYARKLWTNYERQAMQARAFQEHQEYILPARSDDTPIPSVLPAIGYVSLAGRGPSESGIAFFVVGTYLAILGSIGTLGIISFELSRILGLEDHVRRATS